MLDQIDIPSAAVQLGSCPVGECIVWRYGALAHTWDTVHPLRVLLQEAVKMDRCALLKVVRHLHFDLGGH